MWCFYDPKHHFKNTYPAMVKPSSTTEKVQDSWPIWMQMASRMASHERDVWKPCRVMWQSLGHLVFEPKIQRAKVVWKYFRWNICMDWGRYVKYHPQIWLYSHVGFLRGFARSCQKNTSSTAQGGGGSFKNRKPIGEVGCCESRMAERIHWWAERVVGGFFLSGWSGHLTTTAGCSVV